MPFYWHNGNISEMISTICCCFWFSCYVRAVCIEQYITIECSFLIVYSIYSRDITIIYQFAFRQNCKESKLDLVWLTFCHFHVNCNRNSSKRGDYNMWILWHNCHRDGINLSVRRTLITPVSWINVLYDSELNRNCMVSGICTVFVVVGRIVFYIYYPSMIAWI